MPEKRLQRTRDVYDEDRGPTWEEIVYAFPPIPVHEYRIVTDPKTGRTTRQPLRMTFVPFVPR